jgi:cytochrome P450
VVWTPRHGGHWILSRADDIAWAQQAYEIFSHREFMVPRAAGMSLPPITLDPPENLPFRAVLTPSFTPKQVRDVYQPKIRALTVELIEQLRPRGACEFVSEFASIMPVSIFLGVAGLPVARREEFLQWACDLGDPLKRVEAMQRITGYLAAELEARGPGDDLLGRIAAARDDPRFPNKAEVVNMAMLIFLGGLDTVSAQLSFAMRTLCVHPGLQQRLGEDPAIAADAAEEFLRRHGVSATARLVVKAVDHKGARMLPGDMVMVPSIAAGLDDRRYPEPMTVDFDRQGPPHSTFGAGPHKCVGQFLARMELQIFLEEWSRRMPEVRLDPTVPALTAAGGVSKMTRLNIRWDPQDTAE